MSNINPRAGAAKKLDPLKTHDGMASMTRGDTLGGPTQGDPPDASSPLPTDHEKQHASKTFPIPAKHPAMKSCLRNDGSMGSAFDPTMADKVMGDAVRPANDFAPLLHTLPAQVTEEGDCND